MPGDRLQDLPTRWRRLPVGVRDAGLAAVFVLVTQVELVARVEHLQGPPLLQHLLMAVISGAVALRRTRPLVAAVVVGCGMAATGALGTAPSAAVFLVYLLVTCSVAWYAPSRRTSLAGLLALVLPDAVVYPLAHPAARNVAEIVINAGIPVALWLFARLGREHLDRAVTAERDVAQERLRVLEERTRHAETTAEERRRISRECHDVIGHGITLMLLYTEAAQARLDGREPEVSRALDVVAEAGRTALADVHQVLEVLRTEEGPDAAVGGLDEVDELVERVRGAGTPVDWRATDLPRELPATVSTTAYRVVQEALTNVLRHAPGAAVRVRLCGDQHVVRVEVTDDGGAAPDRNAARPGTTGLGLVGIRERVALLGGELDAGPRGDRPGWRVTAALPIAAARR
ncbi:sensor histidine kinase [Blastococcus sp. SYSU D00669]